MDRIVIKHNRNVNRLINRKIDKEIIVIYASRIVVGMREEILMNPLAIFVQEFFNFLGRATYGKFFTFLIFLLVLFYLWKH